MTKVTIVGAGNVGATLAQRLVEQDLCDVALLDVVEGLPQGKALDMMQSASVLGFKSKVTGSNDYEESAGSDIIVITAGIVRKPGMTREDLLATNAGIVTGIVRQAVTLSPHVVLIIVTNPVDAMTYLAFRESGLPRERVVGLSGVLDGARLAHFVGLALGMPSSSVSPCVIGEHGENMVVVPRLTMVASRPLSDLLPADKIAQLIQRTVKGGAEIVGLLKSGSAFYAPSASAAAMVIAILKDEKRVLNCAACLESEYGLREMALGVPVRLGRGGIQEVIQLELTPDEKQALQHSAEAVRSQARSLFPDE